MKIWAGYKKTIRGWKIICLGILLMAAYNHLRAGEIPREDNVKSDVSLVKNVGEVIPRGSRWKTSDKFSNILLRTHHGKPVRFYDDLVKDRAVMINLMYTDCPKICPGNSLRLARLHDLLEHWMGREINILSLSIDPVVDTPERLKAYWEAFGAKPGWTFLTGDFDEIDRLRRQLGVYDLDPVIDADKTQHSGVLTIGNDRTDRWIALPILMHERQLAETIIKTTWDGRWIEEKSSDKSRRKDTAPTYPGVGVIHQVDEVNGQVLIAHEDIPGLMPAMTMMFPLSDRAHLKGLTPNQRVRFVIEGERGAYALTSVSPYQE